MLEIKHFKTEKQLLEVLTREDYIDFLYNHLERFGDDKVSIGKCLDYAFSKNGGQGGFAMAAYYENKLVGALIMNSTGMSGYIPENILVYVAVDGSYRGKGFGQQIIERSFELCDGNVKLHVEYDNPAKRLYERLGFVNKYAEMRYEKPKN
jgi:ribosomal-protein-alanine N-acetyltransferase